MSTSLLKSLLICTVGVSLLAYSVPVKIIQKDKNTEEKKAEQNPAEAPLLPAKLPEGPGEGHASDSDYGRVIRADFTGKKGFLGEVKSGVIDVHCKGDKIRLTYPHGKTTLWDPKTIKQSDEKKGKDGPKVEPGYSSWDGTAMKDYASTLVTYSPDGKFRVEPAPIEVKKSKESGYGYGDGGYGYGGGGYGGSSSGGSKHYGGAWGTKFRIVEQSNGKEISRFTADHGFRFSEDGKLLLFAQMKEEPPPKTIKGEKRQPDSGPAQSMNPEVTVVDLKSKSTFSLGEKSGLDVVSPIPGSDTVAILGKGQNVSIVNWRTGKAVGTFPVGEPVPKEKEREEKGEKKQAKAPAYWASKLSVSPNGKLVSVYKEGPGNVKIEVYDLTQKKKLSEAYVPHSPSHYATYGAAHLNLSHWWSDDSNLVAVSPSTGLVELVDRFSGNKLHRFSLGNVPISNVRFCGKSSVAIIQDSGGHVSLWNVSQLVGQEKTDTLSPKQLWGKMGTVEQFDAYAAMRSLSLAKDAKTFVKDEFKKVNDLRSRSLDPDEETKTFKGLITNLSSEVYSPGLSDVPKEKTRAGAMARLSEIILQYPKEFLQKHLEPELKATKSPPEGARRAEILMGELKLRYQEQDRYTIRQRRGESLLESLGP